MENIESQGDFCKIFKVIYWPFRLL